MPIASVAVPAAIQAGGSILSGILGGSAASKAAAAQQQAYATATQGVKDATAGAQAGMGNAVGIANQDLSNVWTGQQSNLNPYLQAGTIGATSLAQALQPGGALTSQFSFDPSNLDQDPGYQFNMSQGLQAIQRSAAATGTLGSGGTLKAITSFAQGLAGNEYQNAYNRALTTFQTNRNNTLQGYTTALNAGLSGTSQYNQAAENFGNLSSANTIQGAQYGGNVGLQGAEQAGQFEVGGGNAQAAGIVGQANAMQGIIGGVTNAAQYAANQYYNPSTSSTSSSLPYFNPSASLPSYVAPSVSLPSAVPGSSYSLPSVLQQSATLPAPYTLPQAINQPASAPAYAGAF